MNPLVSYPHSSSPGSCFKFDYILEGANTGQLNIKLRNVDNSSIETFYWRANLPTGKWVNQSVNLHFESNFEIVLEAQRLKDSDGNVSIDNIVLEENECPESAKSCDFEEPHICGYSNDFTGDNPVTWQWASGVNNTGNGPSEDHSSGSGEGHYAYVDGSAPGLESGSLGVLASPVLRKDTEQCFMLWVHMQGEDVGEFNIYQKELGETADVLKWHRSGDRTARWDAVSFPLEDFTEYSVIFQVVLGTPGNTHVAIDDVNVMDYDCSISGACKFNNLTLLCSWVNIAGDDINWEMTNGYIYIDTKAVSESGKKGDLMSEELVPTGAQGRCATFEYFIQGEGVGCITVSVAQGTDNRTDMWNMCGSNGTSKWNKGQFPIISPEAFYRVYITGTTGTIHQKQFGLRIRKMSFLEDGCDIQPPEADPSLTTTTITTHMSSSWTPPTTSMTYQDVGDCDFEEDFCNWEAFTDSK